MVKSTSGARVFIPQNELENLLWAAATGGAEQGARFQAALLEHDLYAATPKPMQHGTLAGMEKVDLITVDAGGVRGIAVFTSLERLADSFPSAGYVQTKGSVLLEVIRRQGVVLNFNQPHAVAWTPEAIGRVLDAAKPRLV
jgi:hypothetical protein